MRISDWSSDVCSSDLAVSVASGGSLAPGNSPGRLSTGDLTLAAGSTLTVEIDGTAAGTEYDQIAVTGSVDVTGSTLATTFGFTSVAGDSFVLIANDGADAVVGPRSEEHTSELQSLMRNSYAVFCLKKEKTA